MILNIIIPHQNLLKGVHAYHNVRQGNIDAVNTRKCIPAIAKGKIATDLIYVLREYTTRKAEIRNGMSVALIVVIQTMKCVKANTAVATHHAVEMFPKNLSV